MVTVLRLNFVLSGFIIAFIFICVPSGLDAIKALLTLPVREYVKQRAADPAVMAMTESNPTIEEKLGWLMVSMVVGAVIGVCKAALYVSILAIVMLLIETLIESKHPKTLLIRMRKYQKRATRTLKEKLGFVAARTRRKSSPICSV